MQGIKKIITQIEANYTNDLVLWYTKFNNTNNSNNKNL